MTLLVIIEGVVIALLLVLVAGLLKSHAEILRQLDAINRNLGTDPGPRPVGTGLGKSPLADLTGVDPRGSSVSISLEGGRADTLLAFLSSGCASCLVFWEDLGTARQIAGLDARTVVVTKGPEYESPSKISSLAPSGVPVVMSDHAWDEFRVPLTPYFALLAPNGEIRGEGSATSFDHLSDLLAQSMADSQPVALDTKRRANKVDQELRSSGVEPGDESLYEDPLKR